MSEQIKQVLELFSQPAFIAKDEHVLWCNSAAHSLIAEGTPLDDLIEDKDAVFSSWDGQGTMQISLNLYHVQYNTSVRHHEGGLLFVLSAESSEIKSSARAVLNASASLRKPLQSLLSAASELFDQMDTDRSKDAAAEVNRAIYRLMRLCGQMSDGSRLLLQQMEAHRSPINLQRFFDGFVTQVRPLIESSKHSLVYTPLNAALHADVDPDLLERALFNLISNALTYTPKGGSISLRLQKQAKRLFISVSDTGEGIPPEVISSLFERYADQSIGDSRWGLGFGLPMVREIAKLHGGTMMISTDDATAGTTAVFSISLETAALKFRSPMFRYDYCGGLNHALVELSDALGSDLYHPQDI